MPHVQPDAESSTQCAPGCGACCNPVIMVMPPEDMNGPSGPFAREHWHVISSRDNTNSPTGLEYHLRCDQFDPHTRRCGAYAVRPPICANYPGYGHPLEPGHPKADAIPLVCAFQADVRHVLPLVAINGR